VNTSLETAFQAIRRDADAELERNRKRYRRRMQCRPGCDECCRRLFQVSELEAAALSGSVAALEPELRRRLERRARAYLVRRREILAERGYVQTWGALPRAGERLECPALIDGRCAVYAARPISCRLYGAPLAYPSRPGRIFACELNFRPGERIPDPGLPERQAVLHQRIAELEAEYDRRGGRRFDEPVTVAHAIIEDFRRYPPE